MRGVITVVPAEPQTLTLKVKSGEYIGKQSIFSY